MRIKGWWSELGDIYDYLLKEVWESIIIVKLFVEINIIGVRLNFISFKICFLSLEKLICIFKVILIWNILYIELFVICF